MVKNLPAIRETLFDPWVREDYLEKGMATHARVLTWRIPWTEEPDKPMTVNKVHDYLQRVANRND